MNNYHFFPYRQHLQWLWMFISIFVFMMIIGCGDNVLKNAADDESFEARLEAARIALDDREYTEAKELLLDLLEDNPDSDVVRQYLSNSWSGLAGLDVINLLEIIDQLDENSDSGNIEMFGKVLGDDNGVILKNDLFNILSRLDNAFITMDEINLVQNLNKDQIIQLGIVGASHMAFVIAEIIFNDKDGLGSITLTEEGIASLYEEEEPQFDEQEATDQMIEDISRDIFAVNSALEELGKQGQNDIAEDLEDFIYKIDPDANGIITRDELENYVASL